MTSGVDRTVRLWDSSAKGVTRSELYRFGPFEERVESVALSPDGKVLAVSSGATFREFSLWDIASRRHIADVQGHDGVVTNLAFAPDGQTLASAGRDGTVRLWDVQTRRQKRLPLLTRAYWVRFSPDGRTLCTAQDGFVTFWSVLTGQETGTLDAHEDWIADLAFSPDGNALATTSVDRMLRLWRAAPLSETAAAAQISVGDGNQ